MRLVISETTRRAYPQLCETLLSSKPVETFVEFFKRKGIKDPKPKSAKYYNALACRSTATPNRKFPDDKSFAHRFMIERQSPLFYLDTPDDVSDGQQFSSRGLTDWYVGEFCRLNHLRG